MDFSPQGLFLSLCILGTVSIFQGPGFDPWVGKISLEKRLATHSNILACIILWTEEAGRLQALGFGDEQGSLECCSSWSLKELHTTERLTLSLS